MLESVENKYYEIVEKMSEKGIPADRVVDTIERRGIPSLPLVIALILLAVWGIWVWLHPSYVITVYGYNGEPYSNKPIIIDGKTFTTNAEGQIIVGFKPESIRVPVDGIITKFDPTTLSVSLEPITKTITILTKDAKTGKPVTATIQASGIANTKSTVGTELVIKMALVNADGALQADDDGVVSVNVVADGYYPATQDIHWSDVKNGDVITIKLQKKEPPKSTILIQTNPPIYGYARLYRNGIDTGMQTIINNGVASLSSVPYGQYVLKIIPIVGGKEYYDPNGRNQRSIIISTPQTRVSMDVYVPPQTVQTKIRVVDANTGAPIPGAAIIINDTTATTTDAQGWASISIEQGKSEQIAVTAQGYHEYDGIVSAGVPTTIELKKVITQGALKILVTDEDGTPIGNAKVSLIHKSDKITKTSNTKGVVLFPALPVTVWTVVAESPDGTLHAEKNVAVEANKTVSVHIALLKKINVPIHTRLIKNGRPIGAIANIVVYSQEGRELWKGQTNASGDVTADLPAYRYVIVKATVGGDTPAATYSAPIMILPQTTIDLNIYTEPTDEKIAKILTATTYSPVLTMGNGKYVIYAIVSGKGAFKQIVRAKGIKLEGTLPVKAYPIRSTKEQNSIVIASQCQGTCTIPVPIVVESNTTPGCVNFSIGDTIMKIGAGIEIPVCENSEYCAGFDVQNVAKIGTFVPITIAAVFHDTVASTSFDKKNGDVYFDEKYGTCKSWSGYYTWGSAEVGIKYKNPISLSITTTTGHFRVTAPIQILDGNVEPIAIHATPVVAIYDCNKNIIVNLHEPEHNYPIVVTEYAVSGRNSERIKTVTVNTDENGDGSTILPPANNSATRELKITAAAPLTFPGTLKIPVIQNAFKISGSATLAPNKTCADISIVPILPEVFNKIGPISNPHIVVDSVSIVGEDININSSQASKILYIKQKIIEPNSSKITVCVKEIPKLKEDAIMDITYHIIGSADKISCKNVPSGEGKIRVQVKGTGECLSATWKSPPPVVISSETHRGTVEVLLKNTCSKTSVSGKISVAESANPLIKPSPTTASASLGPGSVKIVRITLSAEKKAPILSKISATITYQAKGKKAYVITLSAPVINEDASQCITQRKIIYDDDDGLAALLQNKCKELKVTGAAVGIGAKEYNMTCNSGKTALVCWTKDIPFTVAAELLSKEGSTKSARLAVVGTAVRWKVKLKAGPYTVEPDKVPITRMVTLYPDSCEIYNRTPFQPGAEVTTQELLSKTNKYVLIPPKGETTPPSEGSIVNVCDGTISAKVVLLLDTKKIPLGSCKANIHVNTTTIELNAPAVAKLDRKGVKYKYQPAGANIAYAVNNNEITPYILFGKYACQQAPCDAKRAAIAALHWAADEISKKETGKSITFKLITNEQVQPWKMKVDTKYADISTAAKGTYTINDTKYIDTELNITYLKPSGVSSKQSVELLIPEKIATQFAEINWQKGTACDKITITLSKKSVSINTGKKTQNKEFPVITATCQEDSSAGYHLFKMAMGNNPKLLKNVILALVNIQETVPKDALFQKYPIMGTVTPPVSTQIMPTTPSGAVTINITGVGPVPFNQIFGKCDTPVLAEWVRSTTDITQQILQQSPYSEHPVLMVHVDNRWAITTENLWSKFGPKSSGTVQQSGKNKSEMRPTPAQKEHTVSIQGSQ